MEDSTIMCITGGCMVIAFVVGLLFMVLTNKGSVDITGESSGGAVPRSSESDSRRTRLDDRPTVSGENMSGVSSWPNPADSSYWANGCGNPFSGMGD